MKKTVWVLSLVVMLLSQIITPFAYAVSGEEVPMPEPVVEEIVPEPEVVEPEKTTDLVSPEYDQESVIVIVEPEKSWELSWDNNEYSWVVIPKEIRKVLRIKEGDPLEIFTDQNGEVVLKKYSPTPTKWYSFW